MLLTTALAGVLLGAPQDAARPQAQTPAQAAPAPTTTAQPAARPTAEAAQERTPPSTPVPTEEGATDLGVIDVTGTRPRGSADTDIPPDVTLSAEDIQAYGAGSIAELLSQIEPLTRSSRGGQPVFLINGRRTTGFRELAGLPPEAIERLEVLPEEVALRYGYSADQRVVNFVLKQNFNSKTIEGQVGAPTAGGRSNVQLNTGLLNINRAKRWNIDVELQRQTSLYETERDIVRDPGGQPFDRVGNVTSTTTNGEIDPALTARVGTRATVAPVPTGVARPTLNDFVRAYGPARTGDLTASRTLQPETERALLRGAWKQDLDTNTQGTVSFSVENTQNESYLGLPGLTLTVPAGNGYSPFAGATRVYRYLDAPETLKRESETLNLQAGVLLDGYWGEFWRWNTNVNFTRVESDTDTGRGVDASAFQTRLTANDPTANPFGPLTLSDVRVLPRDAASSVSQRIEAELGLNGDLFALPAGDLQSTFTFSADGQTLDSTSVRNGVTTDREQSRERVRAQGNFNIPISDPERFLKGIGDLSANLNLEWEELSDFGGLLELGASLNWTPAEPINFLVGYTKEEGAPSISQLNDPVLFTPNTPVFDYRTNQTVAVTQITGGNPNLNASDRTVWRAGFNLTPFKTEDLRIGSTWTREQIDDQLATFPTITAALESALPGRFTRDAAGNLTSIDTRPLNFTRAEREEVRTTISWGKTFGRPRPGAAGPFGFGGGQRPAGAPGAASAGAGQGAQGRPGQPQPGQAQGAQPQGAQGAPAAGGRPTSIPGAQSVAGPGALGGAPIIRFGGPGGPGGQGGPPPGAGGGGGPRIAFGGGGGRGGGIQPGQGRVNLNLTHTWRLQDEVLIRPGLPVYDQLEGQTVSGRSGQPRHELQLVGGVFKDGFGLFTFTQWQAATTLDGGTGPDLRFSPRTQVNLNVFADLGQRQDLVAKHPWLRGVRINLGVRNMFNEEQRVTSSAGGATPVNYQPDFLDPTGRAVQLSIRKILF